MHELLTNKELRQAAKRVAILYAAVFAQAMADDKERVTTILDKEVPPQLHRLAEATFKLVPHLPHEQMRALVAALVGVPTLPPALEETPGSDVTRRLGFAAIMGEEGRYYEEYLPVHLTANRNSHDYGLNVTVLVVRKDEHNGRVSGGDRALRLRKGKSPDASVGNHLPVYGDGCRMATVAETVAYFNEMEGLCKDGEQDVSLARLRALSDTLTAQLRQPIAA